MARAVACATTMAGPAPTEAPSAHTEAEVGEARWAIAAHLATAQKAPPMVAYEPLRESFMMVRIWALVLKGGRDEMGLVPRYCHWPSSTTYAPAAPEAVQGVG